MAVGEMIDPGNTENHCHSTRTLAVGLQHLRFAVAAGDCGSFRRAADSLAVKHSVLSRSISQLEHLIGAAIFERSSGGVRSTLVGRDFLRKARFVLEQVDTLVETQRSARSGNADRLSVGFSTSMSAGNLRATILELKKRLPQVDVVTVERAHIDLANALQTGIVDIVISPGLQLPVNGKKLALWSERILVTLPEDHALATRDAISWIDLRNETILLSEYDPLRELEGILISEFSAAEERPKIERRCVSRSSVKSFASMGLGISLVLESDLGATLAELTYRELQHRSGSGHVSFYAHWRDNNENPALERFVKLLAECYPSPAAPVGG